MTIDRLLQPSVHGLTEGQLESARGLEELGLLREIEERNYVKCVSPEDDDYFEVKERGCDEEIDLSEVSAGNIPCPGCGRNIELFKKTRRSRLITHRDDGGVYSYVRDVIKQELDARASKINNGLRFLDTRLKPAFTVRHGANQTRFLIQFEYTSPEILDSIQVFNQPLVVVLVGNAVPQTTQYEQRGLTCVAASEIIKIGDSSADIEQLVSSARESKIPAGQLADKGIDLYSKHRSSYTWREFEHTVQHCFSASFETSRLLGGEESGEQVPEGVLSLDYEDSSHAYIWDAKYVQELGGNRGLSGEYENMAKHLVNFRRESNVKDIYDDLSGYLIISPSVSDSSMVRLAERIQRRLTENDDDWNGAVTHLQFDALVHIFQAVQSNRDGVQAKPRAFRKHVHRLFTKGNYHNPDPETYREADQRVFDVSTEDVDKIFREFIAPQEAETERVNIDGYLANIRSLDY